MPWLNFATLGALGSRARPENGTALSFKNWRWGSKGANSKPRR